MLSHPPGLGGLRRFQPSVEYPPCPPRFGSMSVRVARQFVDTVYCPVSGWADLDCDNYHRSVTLLIHIRLSPHFPRRPTLSPRGKNPPNVSENLPVVRFLPMVCLVQLLDT